MPVDAGSSTRRRTRLRGGLRTRIHSGLLRTAALAAVVAVALASGGGAPRSAAPRVLDAAPVSFTDPAPPASLSLAPGDQQLTASWPASTEANVRGYLVSVDGVARPEQTALTVTLTGLTNGRTYSVAVKTVTYNGGLIGIGAQGPFTGTQSTSTSTYPRDSTAPAAPASTSATAGDGQVVVSWAANTTDADVAGYAVYRNGAAVSGLVAKPATSWTDTGLVNDTTYTYTVRTQDLSRNLSVDSPSKTATPTDLTPPAAPTGLAAVRGDGQVSLSWTASPETDLAAYGVYRGGALVATVPGPATTYSDTGLVNDTAYGYTLDAVDTHANRSARSSPAVSATPTDLTPPPVPTGVTATPGDTTAQVSWTAVPAPDLASYRVLRADGSTAATVAAPTTTVTLTGLANGVATSLRVVSVDTHGNASAPSAAVSVTPVDRTPPPVPTGVTATPGAESLTVSWTTVSAADLASYRVLLDGQVAGTAPAGTTTLKVTGLVGGRAYSVTVVAVDTTGNASAASTAVTATPVDTTPPPAPTGVVVSAAPSTLTVSWNAVAAADLASYRVLLDGKVIGTVPAGTTTLTTTGLTGTASHTITVIAVDTAGNASAPSTPVTASHLDKTPPSTPTGTTATPLDGAVAVSWNTVADTDLATYTVFRDGVAVATITAGTTTTTVTGLTNGTRYAFTVAAVDTSGNASPPSAAASATPVDTTPPPAPTGVRTTGGDHAVTVSWTAVPAPDLASYRVLLDGTVVATVPAGTTTATLTGLVEGRSYTVTVVAVDTAGNASAPSAPVAATPADTTPPAAPTGVTASPGPESLTVAWAAVTAPDVAYYRVLVDGAVAATPTGTSATVSGLVGGRAYTVTVVAVDSSGNASTPSAPVTATPVDTTPPAVPTGLVATPGNTTVALSWTAVTAADLAGYEVLQDGTVVATVPASTTSFTATGLTNGTAYSFSVRALDTAGNRSAASTPVSATPAPTAPADTTPPATPTGVQATSGDGQVTVSWAPVADADLASYQVLQDGAVVATVPAGTTSYTVTGLANGTSHSFTVRAVDAAGNTSTAATAVVATPAPTTPPATPTGTPATGAGDGEGLAATRDGRWVVLGTKARLEASDTNSASELYLLDRTAGTARRVAPLPSTWGGTGTDSTNGSAVALSSTGRYLALTTTAKLVATDTNALLDAYRLDLTTGAAQLVSVPASGAVSSTAAGAFAPTPGGSAYATRASVAISADGSRVLFYSARTDLVPNDTNGTLDLFAKDASGGATGAVTRVSATATGANLSRTVQGPALALTPDGRYALFPATSSTGPVVLHRKDLSTGALLVVSTVVSGTTTTEVGVFRDSGDVAISDDGGSIVFSTSAKVGTSTPSATGSTGLAYRKDVTTGALVPLGDGQTTAWEHQTTLDPSGRYGFFQTSAGELPGDTNGHTDTYRRDLQTGALVLVTADASGAAAASPSGPVDPKEYGPILALSADTVLVATLQPLVAGDTNGLRDVYRKDLSTQAVSSAV